MPRFMLLIYTPADAMPSEEESMAQMPQWFALDREMQEAGVLVGGEPLHPIEETKTLRVRDDEVLVTDGPYAETRELLGGFYIIEVADLAAALGWARKIPSVGNDSVEVREIMVIPEP